MRSKHHQIRPASSISPPPPPNPPPQSEMCAVAVVIYSSINWTESRDRTHIMYRVEETNTQTIYSENERLYFCADISVWLISCCYILEGDCQPLASHFGHAVYIFKSIKLFFCDEGNVLFSFFHVVSRT